MQIAIIDYHMGNLRSVSKAIEHVAKSKVSVQVTHDPAVISSADRIVFPGQGAARDCMAEIDRLGLRQCIVEAINTRPFFGICMGLQVLLERSDESPDTRCLGVIEGAVERLPIEQAAKSQRMSLPQMGWNIVHQIGDHPMWHGIDDESYFYFANTYHVCPRDLSLVAARTPYAIDFISAIASEQLFAVQFHPEKSQRLGLRMLSNFLNWRC